ncbi:hypothetical protein F4813DRAFT_401166 [Daldinia decipiens]|uniref:uncharacterized protein n=1 Tax=Daldinia decipiens TaxID=326647 RepID=UPI0020C45D72|nr:uncharacterized protein F4813DRAFT_401166 [Daldinia decipiens]KAI1660201.1 hypothetical protein F4813DRAFT_401166 [Daldinia decipiens]
MANTDNNQYVGGGTGAGSQQRANNSDSISGPRPTQNQIPLPHYFIVRPGTIKHTASGTVTTPGPIVPLVAVDQLPEWLDLFGVPRELSVEQTVGLRNLGTAVRNPKFYQVYMRSDLQASPAAHQGGYHTQTEQGQRNRVQGTNNSTLVPVDIPTTSTSPSTSSSTSLTSADPTSESSPTTNGPNTQATNTSNPHTKPVKTSQHPRFPSTSNSTPPTNPYPLIPAPAPAHFLWYPPSTSTSTSTTRSKPHPHPLHLHLPRPSTHSHHTNGSPSSPYCKHWCHRGTCRWGAHCRYAHEMPTTAAGLRDVGLAHHPAWYTTAVSMAFGPGALGLGWCPPLPPLPPPPSGSGSAGGGVLRYREKERVEKREKKSVGAGAGAGVGKRKGKKEMDGKSSGGDEVLAEAELRKEDAAEEENVDVGSNQGQKQPDVVEKLVEI